MSIHEIFSIPIYETKLELDTEKIESFCKEYQSTHDSANKTNVGGYQSHDLQLNHPILQPLIAKLVHHSGTFRGNAQVISNMWFNVNQYKDSNAPHIHPLSVYSGVYYVTTPENCGQILDRDFLVENLRGISWQSYDRSIDVLVSRLRNKLHKLDPDTEYIKTIHGVGYKFIDRIKK